MSHKDDPEKMAKMAAWLDTAAAELGVEQGSLAGPHQHCCTRALAAWGTAHRVPRGIRGGKPEARSPRARGAPREPRRRVGRLKLQPHSGLARKLIGDTEFGADEHLAGR